MASLTTALGLTLCFFWASAFEQVKPDFNLDGMEGDWWLVGMASNSDTYTVGKEWWLSGLANFTAVVNGSMAISYKSMRPNGSCYSLSRLALKGDAPGEFNVIMVKPLEKLFNFVSVKKDEYALVYELTTNVETGNFYEIYLLFAREERPHKELLKSFKDLASGKGISEENMVYPSPKDLNAECVA